LATFKGRLNAGSVGKLTPAHLKEISRHARDLIVSPEPRLPCFVLSEQYCSRSAKKIAWSRSGFWPPNTAR
jgi:hypothetical protein